MFDHLGRPNEQNGILFDQDASRIDLGCALIHQFRWVCTANQSIFSPPAVCTVNSTQLVFATPCKYVFEMFQTALGRLGSAVIAPDESLDLHVFIDAGGRANSKRIWGGLALVDTSELSWVDSELSRLRILLSNSVEPTGELKGKSVLTHIAKETGVRFRGEDRRILFWANWYPEFDGPELVELRTRIMRFLDDLRPSATNLERSEIESWHEEMRKFFRELLPVNGHKILSVLAHLGWLFNEIAKVKIGSQFRSARVIVDTENLPTPDNTNRFLRSFVAAGLQGVGMSNRRTGGCFRRGVKRGCDVDVDAFAKSEDHSGIQYVDILLQVVQRQLPGFAEPKI